MGKVIVWLWVALMVVGFGCGYALGYTMLGYLLMHIGGLGSLGLLACGVGSIARSKGYGYWPAFNIALSSSVLIGAVGAFLVPPVEGDGRPAACGGSLSLAIALVILAFWGAMKTRVDVTSQHES